MNDPALIAVFENGLHPQAKFLYSILHAYAGAGGVAVVPESHVAGIMRIGHDRLRGYRSMLNKSGYCSVVLSGASLVFRITSDHLTRESDHQVITDPQADIAPALTGDHLTRESDHQAITDPTPQTPSDHLAREIARGASESDRQVITGGDNRGGMNERVLSNPLPGDDLFQSIRPDDEQKATVAILTDPAIRLGAWKARQIAQRHPFVAIRAYCCDYVAQGKRPLDDAGLIDWWLKNEPVPPLVENELYQRHRTPEEIAAAAAQRLADEERYGQAAAEISPPARLPAEDTQDTPAPDETRRSEPDEIWAATLAQLATQIPGPTFETWLRDTSLLSVEDGTYTVGVPHASAREWLHSRLRQPVQNALSRQAKRAVTVEFAVRPRQKEK